MTSAPSPLVAARSEAEGLTSVFARYIAGAQATPLLAQVRHATLRTTLNWLGCALGARDEATVAPVLAVARALGGHPQATVLGYADRTDAVNAALVNGVAANALDFDDMHVPTLIHPSVPVVAAALALAEQVDADGETFLRAVTTGIEIECRLGLALFPAHYDAGWHGTSTLGSLGAAAAAAVVLRLTATQVAHALAIAATQSGGLRAMLPNACKSFNVGRAAAAGTLAALLARAGLDSTPRVLEEKFGLFHVFGRPRDPGALTAHLGDTHLVTEVSLKPYPCGVVIHPLIDACLALDPGVRNRIDCLEAFVSPRALDLADRPHPRDAIGGRFSLQHAAALALVRGSAGLDDFETTDVADPKVSMLRARITVTADAALDADSARVRVVLDDASVRESHIDHPSGSPQLPLTDTQLAAKFLSLARRTLSDPAASDLLGRWLALDQTTSMAALVGHCRPTPAQRAVASEAGRGTTARSQRGVSP